MATKFAAPPLTYAPPSAPNITVAYIAGPAVAAANDAIGKLPDNAANKSLDELSADNADEMAAAFATARARLESAIADREHYHATVVAPAVAFHRSVKAQGQDSTQVFAYLQACEREYGDLTHAVDIANAALGELPAPTVEALAYKLKALTAEDFHLTTTYENVPDTLARDAARILDGSMPGIAAQPPVNPFMRGPQLAWDKKYALFLEADRAARAQEVIVLDLHGKYEAVRSKWPDNHVVTDDPVARAELDAVDYENEERQLGELWSDRTSALMDLFLATAPTPDALAVKLQLFYENAGWELSQADEATRQFQFDARRFGRLGAYPQTDDKLHAAFAQCRADMVDFLSGGDDRYDAEMIARLDAAEEMLSLEPARTIEGVIAKLRASFQHLVGEQWSDRSIIDPRAPEFRRGIEGADRFQQMMWSAIEDLSRIAGLKLEEQGA